MTYAWGEEAPVSQGCQGVDSHCHSANPHDERLRRQQQDKHRRSSKKERKHKNRSITSLPTMQGTSSLRSILKPSTSTENLVRSNYLDKRGRIEDVKGTVPPGVRAYWMRDQQLRKSLKRGKKVQFNENSNRGERRVGLAGSNSNPGRNETFYDDYEEDEDSDDRFGPMVLRSDEESYCKKRMSTPMLSRRSRPRSGSENHGTRTDRALSIVPDMGSVQDLQDGSSSSNYSYCPNEMAGPLDRAMMGSNPHEAERSMFVRGCVKVAGDPNEDIIAFNEMRRQSINQINAFVRSSGRYSQRGYNAYSSAINRRVNVPTRRSVRGNPNFGDGQDFMGGTGNHVHVSTSNGYPNDFARSSLRMSSRGPPNNWPTSGEDDPNQGSFNRAYEGGFERSYVRSSRRSHQSGDPNKQDETMIRGSTRRKSHRRRTGLDNAVYAEARESTRRSKHRREDRGSIGGCHRQSTRRHRGNPLPDLPDLPETQIEAPVTHLAANQSDCPSSRSSSPYFVRPAAQVNVRVQEEIKVSQERPLPPLPPIPPPPPIDNLIYDNGCQKDNFEATYGTQNMEPEEEQPTVPGGGGVPTVGGESNVESTKMLPLAEAVVAGAMRRSARQKKRGIAYFTFRKGQGEVASDLEVIREDLPGRYSPVSTEGHWSAPESTRPKVAPKPPPRPAQRPAQRPAPRPPPRFDNILAPQNVVAPIPVPVPGLTRRISHEEPVTVRPVPVKPTSVPTVTRAISDDEPIPISELLFGKPSKVPPKTPTKSVDAKSISMVDAAEQLEKRFAHIGGRSPPAMPPPDSAPTPDESQVTAEKETPKEKEPAKAKGNKSKKQHKKKKKNKKDDEEKKTKVKEEKEKKEKKKEKKKKKKTDKVKAKTASNGDADDVKKLQPEGTQQTANANGKPIPKKVALKPPKKRSPSVVSEGCQSVLDARRDSNEQGHLTVIKVVDSGAGGEDNDHASEGGGYKSESGLTRLSRKISDRVGTWGKDFKRLLRFRRVKPTEDTPSEAEDENMDNNDVAEHQEEAEHPVPNQAVGQNQRNISGASLGTQPRPKVPLLPPKCTPVPIPVPPPNVASEKNIEDCLNFCDQGKTNQIIYWLQNVAVEDHLAMLTTTTVATQF